MLIRIANVITGLKTFTPTILLFNTLIRDVMKLFFLCVCDVTVSRASLLTGRRPDTNHAWLISDNQYWRQTTNATTIPQYFKENGVHNNDITNHAADPWIYIVMHITGNTTVTCLGWQVNVRP